MIKFLAALLAAVVGAAAAQAQSSWTPHEGIETLERGAAVKQHTAAFGWTFHPIATPSEMVAFLGTLDGTDGIGANVKIMYFTRDGSGEWQSFGWADGNTDGAIAWVRSQHGAGALYRDADCYLHGTGVAVPEAPQLMKNGIFVADPNAAVFQQMAPQDASTVISWLVDAGYAAAPKLAETLITEHEGGPKVLQDVMNYLCNQAEYTLFPLKSTYAPVSSGPWFYSCPTVIGVPTVVQPPGPPTLMPNTVRTLNGQCWYKFTRVIRTRTVAKSGREWYCPPCAMSTVQCQTESTWVVGDCPPAGPPRSPPGNAEWSEDDNWI